MKHILLCTFLFSCLYSYTSAQTFFNKQKRVNSYASVPNAIRISGNTLQRSTLVYKGASIMDRLDITTSVIPSAKTLSTKSSSEVIVHTSEKTGLPIFISSSNQNNSIQSRTINPGGPSTTAFNYLTSLSAIFNIEQPSEHFKISKTESDITGGYIVRLQQHFNDIDVYGKESIIHINANGQPTSWNGTYISPDIIQNTAFNVSETSAAITALAHIKQEVHYHELNGAEKKFLDYEGPEIQRVLYTDDKLIQTCIPAYIISIRPNFIDWWIYVVDASTGNILDSYANTCHADGPVASSGIDLNNTTRNFQTYLKGSTYYMLDASREMYSAALSVLPDNPAGAIQTLNSNNTWGSNTSYSNIQSPNNTWSAVAVSAHYNAGKAYEYYKVVHGRNSIDNLGGTIISFVNVANPDDGTPMDNAYWNGKAMYYGNGNTAFKPLAGGLDVGGHEMTHGVVQSTANLMYKGESGAINESMADVFGCMIDSMDWLIGEDVVLTSAFPSGALRSLSDPHNGGSGLSSPGWQPRHVNEQYKGSGDNGGVHINSGIPNYAFYLLAQSTKRTSAEKIFYRALSSYLTRSSQFIDLRLACIKSADELFGQGSNESVKTGLAFDQVGITANYAPVESNPNSPIQVNPGTEYMLAVDENPSHSYTLYRLNSNGTKSPLSNTGLFSKPSITDDGSTAYFVNSSNQIVGLYLTPGNTHETIIQKSNKWNSVAVSKDGSLLAATQTNIDTTIYVFNLKGGLPAAFTLYNPTYSDGIKSGGPLYADALEWDHTGQYIIYDCFNQFENTSGNNLEYWDINFIQVWDNGLNNYSDGTITKLFNSLPDHVSLGNPTLSKNSPNIMAFDYTDDVTGDAYVLGCNTETSELTGISMTNTLGYPNFNNTDTRVAFTFYDESNDNYQIYYSGLESDKITPTFEVKRIVDYSQWPVYYANGIRTLPSSIKVLPGNMSGKTETISLFPNPCADKISIAVNASVSGMGVIKVFHLSGQLVYETGTSLSSGENTIPLILPASIHAGCYVIQVSNDQESWTSRFIKQ